MIYFTFVEGCSKKKLIVNVANNERSLYHSCDNCELGSNPSKCYPNVSKLKLSSFKIETGTEKVLILTDEEQI